jgi:hypothetical protein
MNRSLMNFVPAFVALTAFMVLMALKFEGFELIPGDLGDSRLNNLFLENVYQYFFGRSESLIHLPFFWPFPYVLGFSDNLWGSSPFYLLPRLCGLEPFVSFQIWYYIGFVANFIGAYYVLKRLQFKEAGAIVGAVFFTFNLPELCQMGHVQLHYRFLCPAALLFCLDFIKTSDFRSLSKCALTVVLQLWVGIYIGIFLILLLLALFAAYCCQLCRQKCLKSTIVKVWTSFREQYRFNLSLIGLSFALALILFYPYIAIKAIYSFDRSWDELAMMLPRLSSYFMMDASNLYGSLTQYLNPTIPLRWEHQIFIGVVPLVLFVCCGYFLYRGETESEQTKMIKLCLFALLILFVVTFSVAGKSLYYFIAQFPLFSSTRAIARIILIMILPITLCIAYAVDRILGSRAKLGTIILSIILVLFGIEIYALNFPTSTKASWEDRLKEVQTATADVSKGEVLFIAQSSKYPPYISELDAMWASILGGFKTINGYSGFLPPQASYKYGNSCSELKNRLWSGAKYAAKTGMITRSEVLNQEIKTIGFPDCQISVEDFQVRRDLEYTFGQSGQNDGRFMLDSGWNAAEIRGTWSLGKKASMNLIQVSDDFMTEMIVDANFLVTPSHNQALKVFVNDKLVFNGVVTEPTKQIVIPLPQEKDLTIVFELPDAVTPKALGINGDRRDLAMGLKKLTFR